MATSKYDNQFQRMTEAPVAGLVMMLAVPTIITMLLTAIYNLVDTAFVGQIGTSASGAVGIVFGYMAILQAVGFMFGQGAGSIISILLGEQKNDDASRFASTGFFSALFIGVVIGILSLIFLDPLLVLLGSTPTILPFAHDYCFYIAIGAPFIIGSFVLNNILRYEGMAVFGMAGMVAGCVLNMIGDPILIFGFGLGTAGAGISTAFSQMVGFGILLIPFARGITHSRISPARYTRDIREIWRILTVGFPSLVRQALSSLATIYLNRVAGIYGDSAIAAMAITNRVAMFLFSIVIGIGQGYQPVCGFNFGAEKYDRVREAFRVTVLASTGMLLIAGIIVFILSGSVVQIFRDDPEVIAIGTPALRYAIMALIFMPFSVNTNMTLQSTGHALSATFLAMLRSGICFLPMLFILSQAFGLTGIEIAQPAADVLTSMITVPFAIIFFKRLGKDNSNTLTP